MTKHNSPMMKYICALAIAVLFSFCNTPDSKEDQFIWDFSTNKKYVYSFNQKSTVIFNDIAKGYIDEMPMDMTAKLNISVKDEQYADLSLTEVMMSKKTTLDTIDELIESPSMVIQDMDSKGKFKTENQNMLFKLMLPLPSKHLHVGESDFTELEVPFTTHGSVLFSKGGTTLPYVKDTIVDGQSLALMAAITDISDIDIPEELTGTYKMSTTGFY